MVKPLVNPMVFWVFLAIVAAVVFISSFFITQQCVDIGGCKSCWSTIDRTRQSEACPANQSCVIEAYVDQHNAVTDALLCACNKARTGTDYLDIELNQKIIDAYGRIYGPAQNVQDVCESGSLVKVRY